MPLQSSNVNLDVVNMISEINHIYSNSYKKFFHINPEKYINIDDLITDLSYLIPKWDSHAYLISRNTFQDHTEGIINSYGNGYIFISGNCKIDSVLSLCKDMIDKGVTNITLNMLQLKDSYKFDDLQCGIILPFVESPQRIVKHGRTEKIYFEFNPETRKYISYQIDKCRHREGIIYKSFKGIKLNLIISQSVVEKWVERLHNSANITIYCYEYKNEGYYSSILWAVDFIDHNKFITSIKNKILHSDYPKLVKVTDRPLPKKFHPMA